MPRYFFNVHNGVTALDKEGTVLKNAKEACSQAIATAGAMMRDEGEDFLSRHDAWSMTIVNAKGKIIWTVRFTVRS